MPVVGERPERGLRLRLVLDRSKRHYAGSAATPHAAWEVAVDLEEAAAVVRTSAPGEVAEYVRRVVRIATKTARQDGFDPPRVIQRWRDR